MLLSKNTATGRAQALKNDRRTLSYRKLLWCSLVAAIPFPSSNRTSCEEFQNLFPDFLKRFFVRGYEKMKKNCRVYICCHKRDSESDDKPYHTAAMCKTQQ